MSKASTGQANVSKNLEKIDITLMDLPAQGFDRAAAKWDTNAEKPNKSRAEIVSRLLATC